MTKAGRIPNPRMYGTTEKPLDFSPRLYTQPIASISSIHRNAAVPSAKARASAIKAATRDAVLTAASETIP